MYISWARDSRQEIFSTYTIGKYICFITIIISETWKLKLCIESMLHRSSKYVCTVIQASLEILKVLNGILDLMLRLVHVKISQCNMVVVEMVISLKLHS